MGDLVILRARILSVGMVIALDLNKERPVSIIFCTGETVEYTMSEVEVISSVAV